MMPSEFEDTVVEDLDVENLTDEQLLDIVQNDSRVTAQDKAQAELNRRDAAEEEDEPETTQEPERETRPLDSTDIKERDNQREGAPVKDSLGYETNPESEALGADQVQARMDQANASGVFPGSGDPPDMSHTVAAVTDNPAAKLGTPEEES